MVGWPKKPGGVDEGETAMSAVPAGIEPVVALLGSFPPRECGIATFTRDLFHALSAGGHATRGVAAIDEPGAVRRYGPDVRWRLDQDDPRSYDHLATALDRAGADVLSIQHEFGLFGGHDGELLLRLLDRLVTPAVVTLHTVLGAPSGHLRQLTRALCDSSAATVVLARAAIPLLADVYGVDPAKVHYIPHGIPTVKRTRGSRRRTKAALGLSGRTVLSTFGLIGPSKGIEHVIRALPEVVRAHPDLLYVVLGQTHPGQLRHAGEEYRESLQGLVAELGLERHVRFDARYLDQDELVRWLLATDVYLMPYLDPEQIVSGTLAYAVGSGKAVVATQFRYARELLSGGRGELVPFRDSDAITRKLLRLLGDRPALAGMERRAYEASREMEWPNVAAAYRRLFARLAAPAARGQRIA